MAGGGASMQHHLGRLPEFGLQTLRGPAAVMVASRH